MTRIIIVPGLGNSGAQHWQSRWQQRLPNAVRINLKQWERPDLNGWLDGIASAISHHTDNYLVAHSFGCLASVKILEQLHPRVRGVLLVAPADPDKFKIADQLPQSTLPVPGLVVGSLSDPWLSWNKAQLWAQRWELPIYCAGRAGHINVESGHSEWSDGWRLLEKLQRPEAVTLAAPVLSVRETLRPLAY